MSTVTRKMLALVAALAIGALSFTPSAFAQTSTASSVLPTGGGAGLLDPSDTALLLLDHQSGLFQTVKDVPIAELRANVVMLAKLAKLMKIPVITTASEPNGTNGPLMPEIHETVPNATYVQRKGEVNAWDNEDFVRTVRATGKKTLIMAGSGPASV
jgi:nicotinamidase-related amidase